MERLNERAFLRAVALAGKPLANIAIKREMCPSQVGIGKALKKMRSVPTTCRHEG